MVHCYLARIILSEVIDHQQILVLRERDGQRSFPIVIGFFEAAAIDRHIKGFAPPRPFTHDLMAAVIEQLGGQLERIVVNELRQGTFFAELHIRVHGEVVTVDARPSDAMAIAVRTETPIFVKPEVLDEAAN